MGTCVGQTQNIAVASSLDTLNSSANEVITQAANAYDYSEFDLILNNETSLVKQKLVQYGKESESLTALQTAILKNTIESDSDYTVFNDLDNLYLNTNAKSDLNYALTSFKQLYNDPKVSQATDGSTYKTAINLVENSSISTCLDLPNSILGGGGTGGSGSSNGSNSDSDKIKFPVHEYNVSLIDYYVNGRLNDCTFFGIACNKDLCIGFYDTIVNCLMNLAYYSTMDIKGSVGIIYKALELISVATPAKNLIVAAWETITGVFASIWTTICNAFHAVPVIGTILSLILIIVGVSTIVLLGAMLVFGYLKKGFAIGWMIHGLFNWEPYCGEIN